MPDNNPIWKGVERAASEKLGVDPWDRTACYVETADAATGADLPYWLILLLSGGIATLGLALNSSAVVIGAMLIAPLLAPVMGLALALAMGDGRLSLQTGAVVLASTLAVLAAGALLTLVLPFQTITPEISARARPSTLDLAIAVFSGLASAVVTVTREKRLSASIPGVAISVALIPPLAVAGFGVGSGWNAELIRGSLLLYGANLAGIVLSGMAVFLLVGMHRPDVIETARRWHREERCTGVAAWMCRVPGARSLPMLRSTAARIGLVLAFATAMALPLGRTLAQLTREARVHSAVGGAAEAFAVRGRSSILGRQVALDEGGTRVFLRVATTEWFGSEARERFEELASTRAGEPVRLTLQQLPASSGEIEELAELIPTEDPRPILPPAPVQPTRLPDLLSEARLRVDRATDALPLPDGVRLAGSEVTTGAGGTTVRIRYAGDEPLPPQAEQILERYLASQIDDPAVRVRLAYVAPLPGETPPLVTPSEEEPVPARAGSAGAAAPDSTTRP